MNKTAPEDGCESRNDRLVIWFDSDSLHFMYGRRKDFNQAAMKSMVANLPDCSLRGTYYLKQKFLT